MLNALYCLIGKSGTGKSTVMQALHDAYGYTIAQSYTDRPKRTPDEQGHVFLSPDEFDALNGLILPRSSQDGRYGMTEEMLDKSELIVLDYLGSHGFGLEVVEVGECDVDAEKVSSTVIRHLVAQGDMARAARLLSHPYLVIGTAAAGRIRTDDPLKLLPPAGSYQVRIGGRPARLTVDASQNLIIRDGCPDGRAVLTF